MSQSRNTRILGMGSYAPQQVVDNFELSKSVDTSDEWIRTRTGIQERRFASSEQSTSDLCLAAAKAALDKRAKPAEAEASGKAKKAERTAKVKTSDDKAESKAKA